jgi:hypothetical protein
MNLRQSIVALWLVALALAISGGVYAASMPSSPQTLTPGETSMMDVLNYGPQNITATAGNITAMLLYGISQTKSWQGFYGNVSGTITLDDANNFTFYNWTSVHPRGQVYATLNNSVEWHTVECFNFTGEGLNLTGMDMFYNISPNDADNINITFNQTDHMPFTVGFRNFSYCPTTYIFQDDQYQQGNFQNVLLWDITNNETGWIYATMIENKTPNAINRLTCYNGQVCDFQLLVNENGHWTDIETTQYYFWVELL